MLAIDRVSGEAGDGLRKDQVDLSVKGVLDHAIEAFAPFRIGACDTLVYVNAVFDTMQIGLLRHIMPGKGLVSWAFAVQSVHLAVL